MGFWRTQEPVIEDYVVKKGGMFEPQRQWWNLDTFVKVLVGGYGSGKTMISSKRLIASALENYPAPVVGVSPTYKMAKRTFVPTIRSLLDGRKSLDKDLSYKYNKSELEFTIYYHGREAIIWIMSGENPESLKGPNIGAAAIDEPFIQDIEVLEQMMARIRHPEAKNQELFLTGTPEQLNWGYDLCEGELSDQYEVGVVHASTKVNVALNPRYYEMLKNAYSDKAVEAYVEGHFVDLSSGLVYYAFSRLQNVKNIPRPEGSKLGVGMDFNVNPMAAVVFWEHQDHTHFFDEIELPNADTEYMADHLTDKYGGELKDVYPDASGASRKTASPGGKSDFWYLTHAGYEINANPANPHRKDRYNAVNGKLRPKSGAPTCTVAPECKKLIKYLSTYSHEQLNKQKQMSHLIDAFGYPISYLYPVTKNVLDVYRLKG